MLFTPPQLETTLVRTFAQNGLPGSNYTSATGASVNSMQALAKATALAVSAATTRSLATGLWTAGVLDPLAVPSPFPQALARIFTASARAPAIGAQAAAVGGWTGPYAKSFGSAIAQGMEQCLALTPTKLFRIPDPLIPTFALHPITTFELVVVWPIAAPLSSEIAAAWKSVPGMEDADPSALLRTSLVIAEAVTATLALFNIKSTVIGVPPYGPVIPTAPVFV